MAWPTANEPFRQVLLNVSTQAIHMSNRAYSNIAADRPGYSLTKGAGTLAMQYIAQDIAPDNMQVVSFHPGVIFSQAWVSAGVGPDFLPFDDCK
jgi:NAD(P)-dependent dehydrogenase (short-subunit alcohol dehydrogenase family)